MHRLFIPIACALGLYACSSSTEVTKTRQELVDAAIQDTLKKGLDDPASYQPAGTVLVDSVTYGSRGEKFLTKLAENKAEFDYDTDRPTKEGFDKIPKYDTAAIGNSERAIRKRVAEMGASTTLYYIYAHKFRAKNKLGALVLDNLYASTRGTAAKLAFIGDELDEVTYTPDGAFDGIRVTFLPLSLLEQDKLYKKR